MIPVQKLFLLTTILAFSILACHNDSLNHNMEDQDPPVISLSAPTAMDSISGVVAISGMVTDESMHEMSIVVSQDSDGTVLFSSAPVVHDLTSYTIAEMWTPAGITAETAVTLTVTAEDHSSNIATAEVKFTVKP